MLRCLKRFDPIKLTIEMEKIVCRGLDRKYFRFRGARYYGGIATGDVVGCNLECVYCYVSYPRRNPRKAGKFYSWSDALKILLRIARQDRFEAVRLSGGEPTLCRKHVLKLLENMPEEKLFVLETNGILLGHDKKYVGEIGKYDNVIVRVSLKGCVKEEFSRITGAKPVFFNLQFKALENCLNQGVECFPALLLDVVDKSNLNLLKEKLDEIDKSLWIRMDFSEKLLLYKHVKERLRKAGFHY